MTSITEARSAAAAAPRTTKAPKADAQKVSPFPASKGALAQFKRNCWVVYAPDTMPESDFETVGLWSIVGKDYQVHDRVEIVQSRRWTEAIVCDVGIGFTNIKVLQSIEMPARRAGAARSIPVGYEIRPGKPGDSAFIVWRLKGDRNLFPNERFDTHDQALRYLVDSAAFN